MLYECKLDENLYLYGFVSAGDNGELFVQDFEVVTWLEGIWDVNITGSLTPEQVKKYQGVLIRRGSVSGRSNTAGA